MRLDVFTMETIWKNVCNDVGKHGDFLKSFGSAFVRADGTNKFVLYEASGELISKYALDKPEYLVTE